jgi:O-glycosyl hydrolase
MKFVLYFFFIFGLIAFLSGCLNEQPTETKSPSEQGLAGVNNAQDNTTALAKTTGTATINAGTIQQYIRGFGGCNMVGWGVGDLTSTQRTLAFSTSSGIGLSVCRVRVSPNSGDWAAEKTTIAAAKSYGATVIASCWSAPASMKDNNNLVGGALLTSAYSSFASHLSSFCTTVGGVSAISPTNEPNISVTYESMKMTASQVAAFVAAQGSNCGASIMAPEPFNMDQSFINSYLSNSTAKSKTGYVCGHIYGVSPSYFNPGKEVWMTEHLVNNTDWAGALATGKEISDCMNAGYNMYVWWYIRRSYGPIDESSNITKRGYVMAQFARYIRPGYNKISCTYNPTSGVYATAYKSGSKIVVVAINQNSATTFQTFTYSGVTITGFTRYKTTSSSNLAQDSFTVSGGSFGINLPASSITTLVSN